MRPRRLEPVVFGMLLSGMMSFLVSGISTLLARDLDADFLGVWIRAWLAAWAFAFPVVLVVAPFARTAARRLLGADDQEASHRAG